MPTPDELLDRNRTWRARMQSDSPGLLRQLADGQSPDILWIGCADSRVPATQIVNCRPGDLFVHRNVANLMVESDANGMSVLTYAIEALGVSDVVVCGHYGCGGVQAVLADSASGVIADWLEPVEDLLREHDAELSGLGEEERWDRCCELNVVAQVQRLAELPVVQGAWEDGHELAIHGWIYQLSDGRIRDLDVTVDRRSFA